MKKVLLTLGLLLGIHNMFGSTALEVYLNDFAAQDHKVMNFEIGFLANLLAEDTGVDRSFANTIGAIFAAYFTAWKFDKAPSSENPFWSTPVGPLQCVASYIVGGIAGYLARKGIKKIWYNTRNLYEHCVGLREYR